MLLTVENSRSSKTRGCAVTYRAAPKEMFGTCPDTCGMKPKATGTSAIDREYEKALGRAVPKGGWSWLYTHFSPDVWKHKNGPKKTVFNFSADTIADAVKYFRRGVPVVTVVPDGHWQDRRAFKQDGLTFMRCPAEYDDKTDCGNCGDAKARPAARPPLKRTVRRVPWPVARVAWPARPGSRPPGQRPPSAILQPAAFRLALCPAVWEKVGAA
jgi:hypothetical protein